MSEQLLLESSSSTAIFYGDFNDTVPVEGRFDPDAGWSPLVRILVPIVCVLSFVLLQVIIYFIDDPGLKKSRYETAKADEEMQQFITLKQQEANVAAVIASFPCKEEGENAVAQMTPQEIYKLYGPGFELRARYDRRTLSESDAREKGDIILTPTESFDEKGGSRAAVPPKDNRGRKESETEQILQAYLLRHRYNSHQNSHTVTGTTFLSGLTPLNFLRGLRTNSASSHVWNHNNEDNSGAHLVLLPSPLAQGEVTTPLAPAPAPAYLLEKKV